MLWSELVIPTQAGIQPAVGPGLRRDRNLSRCGLIALLAIATLSVASCGFKLRGQQTFSFETINVPSSSSLGVELQRAIAASSGHVKMVSTAAEADAVVSILGEQQERVILSLNTQGRVTEYQLRYRVIYSVAGPKGVQFVPPTTINLTRDITFNDQVLAKETEEGQLFREMRSDAVQQIIRRLAAAKPVKPEPE